MDCYFVIIFCLLHFLFQRNLVEFSIVTYRAPEPLKITAREISSPQQP